MIEVKNIRKCFKLSVPHKGKWAGVRNLLAGKYVEKIAVNNISFSIAKGEFVGYIGPNGAGKSTTIKMLTGILHPTSGHVAINGLSPHLHRTAVVRQLGVVFGQRSQLWWDLPVQDSYDILAAMYKLDKTDKDKKLGELRELLELDEFLTTPVRKLSLGQRMRADLAASMLHDPDVLFLDEPTIGLDVAAKKSIRGFLKRLNRELGKTILLTTHDMDDIEQLCGRVMVINNGEIGYDGTIAELRERIGLPTIMRITFRHAAAAPSGTAWPFAITEAAAQTLTLQCNRQLITAMDVLRIVSEWGDVVDVHMEEPQFEDVIHKLY